ncbi:hypothetical protein AS850_04645 [Frondihabitans sp. 762G35]|uniref:hypothetical protein n=1 Tax=Frondihabitans sp. 762G35 TaxID=1446794 RepID=UPI000D20D1DB|nr:hypothetical protein [Frondihabitans sp. 762G35]ARC56363.1 hypothetical protein AS850_04645 [Frondihabitans sp. 762G35]
MKRGATWWLSPLRPVAIGVIAFAVALIVASRLLPAHTVVIWDSAGKRALDASSDDFTVGVLVAGFIVLAVWLVAGLVLTLVPARHVLVPHAAHWKSAGNVPEMRHRFATYLGRAIGATYGFIAVEVLVAVVSQSTSALQTWWPPVVVSILFIVILLIFAVWVFSDGFRPPRQASARRS